MTRNVLIVEDNPGIGELVRMHVADLGMNPILCDRGDTGLEKKKNKRKIKNKKTEDEMLES